MAAHVEKRLQVAVLGAGDEDRHTGLAMREEIPGFASWERCAIAIGN